MKTAPKMPILTEDQECHLLVDYLRLKGIRFTHVPNGTRTSIRQAVRMKKLGVSKGFPDYVVFVPKGILFIEMKRSKRFLCSPEQIEWIDFLKVRKGCDAYVCHGFEDAKNRIELYL